MKRLKFLACCSALAAAAGSADACDLCAVYSSSNAREEGSSGLVLSVAEQYVSTRDIQLNGDSITLVDPQYVESSFTHIVPGYNFTPDFGISLNIPLVHRHYRFFNILQPGFEEQTVSGLGDMSLIARWSPWQMSKGDFSARISLLGGVKLPTGDTEYVERDVALEDFYDRFFPAGHDHAITPIHAHELSLGSGSYDGILGVTSNLRWRDFFFNTEFQYYRRTQGKASFKFGDETLLSGGPGYYVFSGESFKMSVQLNAVVEHERRAEYAGRKSSQTGMDAFFLGPNLSAVVGEHFSAQAGIDLPVKIEGNGFMAVPEYRLHGGISWSF